MKTVCIVFLLVAGASALFVSRDPCQNYDCQNGGTCVAPADAPYCMCPYGYTGTYCETLVLVRDPCVHFQCLNGGSCIAPADYPTCTCPSGFGGKHCELVFKG